MKDKNIMSERPETGQIIASIALWSFSAIVITYLLTMLTSDVRDDMTIFAWSEMAFLAFNGIGYLILFKGYLKDSLFIVQISVGRFLKVVGWTVGVMILVTFVQWLLPELLPLNYSVFNALPMSEPNCLVRSGMLPMILQVPGVLMLTLLTPFTVTCLFYVTVFAPICTKRPILAYVVMAAVLALPHLYDILSYGMVMDEVTIYLLRLPLHLLACRAYQRANTVWAPIVCVAVLNLISSIAALLMYHIGWIVVI